MKISKHLTFFYLSDRLQYVHRLLEEANRYPYETDVFIHANTEFDLGFSTYTNGKIQVLVHDLGNEYPYYLTWKCRDLLKAQKNEYDVFMYMENDVLVRTSALEYWLTYKDMVLDAGYNLGFLRIETSTRDGEEYTTDIGFLRHEGDDKKYHFVDTVDLSGLTFSVNNVNPYCAFWIYDQKEFCRFVESEYYTIHTIKGYGIPEASAVGLHGMWTPWYKATLIPLQEDQLHKGCKIYHLPNNFVNNETYEWKQYRFVNVLYNNAVSNGVLLQKKQVKDIETVHKNLVLHGGSFADEIEEQKMSVLYIESTDRVLELGGNIGRNSLVIASLLDDSSKLTVLETNPTDARILFQNRDANDFHFRILPCALSKRVLIQHESITHVHDENEPIPDGYFQVQTMDYSRLCSIMGYTPNVLVCDCEGALYQILVDEPTFLDGFTKVILENDFWDRPDQEEYVHQRLRHLGFSVVYSLSYYHVRPDFWQVWIRS